MGLKVFLLCILLSFTSCVRFHYTSDGGVRVNNPKVFEYNKPKYTTREKSLIDTNAIYLLDSVYNKWDILPRRKIYHHEFARFFSTGQVLFVSCDSMPHLELINNKNVGTPGYFILQDDKIKIDMFQNLNGGQTGKYYGRVISSGDLIFYEQRPETYYSSFYLLEQAEGKARYSYWKKIKVANIENYKLDW